jgi:hypothetical protein
VVGRTKGSPADDVEAEVSVVCGWILVEVLVDALVEGVLVVIIVLV